MKTHSRFLILLTLSACVLGASSASAKAQDASGQTMQSRTRDRKPPEKDQPLKSYLPREASIRLPQRNAVRGGIDQGATSHFSKGEMEYRAGRNAAAVPELKQAVKESPDSYDSHYLLALALTETGQLKEAIAEFAKAIELAPNDDAKIVAYYNMANAYFDVGDYQNAANAYQSSLKIDPRLSRVRNNLGLALVGLNQLSDATAEFKRATDLKPEYAEAHFNLGVAYAQMGNKNKAREQQQILLQLKPELASKLADLFK